MRPVTARESRPLSLPTPGLPKFEKGPPTAISRVRKGRLGSSTQVYLHKIPTNFRQKIKRLYKVRNSGRFPKLNDARREVLADCIFQIENELSHKHANLDASKKPLAIQKMNNARNRIYDEIGWNEERACC